MTGVSFSHLQSLALELMHRIRKIKNNHLTVKRKSVLGDQTGYCVSAKTSNTRDELLLLLVDLT